MERNGGSVVDAWLVICWPEFDPCPGLDKMLSLSPVVTDQIGGLVISHRSTWLLISHYLEITGST